MVNHTRREGDFIGKWDKRSSAREPRRLLDFIASSVVKGRIPEKKEGKGLEQWERGIEPEKGMRIGVPGSPVEWKG